VKLKAGETVVLAWGDLQVRAHRDRRQRQGHEGPAARHHDGPQGAAIRWQAHVLGRIQAAQSPFEGRCMERGKRTLPLS